MQTLDGGSPYPAVSLCYEIKAVFGDDLSCPKTSVTVNREFKVSSECSADESIARESATSLSYSSVSQFNVSEGITNESISLAVAQAWMLRPRAKCPVKANTTTTMYGVAVERNHQSDIHQSRESTNTKGEYQQKDSTCAESSQLETKK